MDLTRNYFFAFQKSGMWVYQNHEAQLMMNLGSYLTVYIADFSLDLNQVPRKTKKTSDG